MCTKRIGLTFRLLAVTALVALAGTLVMAQPARIGEPEPANIATPHPYSVNLGDKPLEWVVSYPDATYIRVHFSKFDLADGDWVEISSPDGLESYRFTGKGPHGTGHFWASTILGDTAVIRLQSVSGGGFGFEIDEFGRGTDIDFGRPVDPGDPQPDSVCGANDWRDIECYSGSNPDQYDAGRAVARLYIGCCTGCTGFRVSDSDQFMTNNHCTSSQSGVASTEARMDYQNAACGGGGTIPTTSVFGSVLLKTDYTLDYTLFTTTGGLSGYPCLEFEPNQTTNGDQIFIAHHPSGGVKKLSINSDQNAGGVCRVDDNAHNGRGVDSDVAYLCDTTNGSSGSPVLDYDTLRVVGAHHFGGCFNSAGRADLILPQISGLLDSCTQLPGGDPPSCGDGTCNGTEDECSCAVDCGTPPASEVGLCDNGVDDDCDNDTDCNDADCSSDPACVCDPTETSCTDGVDNDCDGDTDCNDADCASDPACGGGCTLGQKNDPCSSDDQCCSNKCRGKRSNKRCR